MEHVQRSHFDERLHMSGIIGRCVCVSVVVQRAGEEACCIAAAAPGTETPETDGGAAAEERCCSEGARDAAGQMYWLTGLELTFDRQFVLSPSSRQFDLWLHTWHQWQATPAGSSDACIQRQLTVKNDAEVVSCEICFKLPFINLTYLLTYLFVAQAGSPEWTSGAVE